MMAVSVENNADHLISETVLSSAVPSVTFDVSSLAALGYKHLQIKILSRSTGNPAGDNVSISFNGDTTYTNYRSHWLTGDGSNASSGTFQSTAYPGINVSINTPDVNYVTYNFGPIIIDLLDFANVSKNKTARSLSGSVDSYKRQVTLGSGAWFNTSAITSLTFKPYAGVSGNFAIDSRFSIYASKG
jgi:hypothetical protein